MGFLTGHELTWMPEALQILRDELPFLWAGADRKSMLGPWGSSSEVACAINSVLGLIRFSAETADSKARICG